MKLFLDDVVNFQYGYEREDGKVIGFTIDGFPLVDTGKWGKTIIDGYKFRQVVIISKSPAHIKWEQEEELRKKNKKNIFIRVWRAIWNKQ